ncbi:UDP-N-acetylmuramoyl-L-alanyl-D-glutamate--2,6-diaminopimelate ligase, partial [Candidatus Saccharibacteria bacterium]|nr:UDP-N-acetylmuramoyl-L-alanyl-D-glutamate--2,6-diaminopimelate ligase [Candidatus Saccharibacteria bacterium]NIV03110.1 UDP-N-acetylmuramoyl-L-alanyl-D-glutamate--2,6-diaminopimelate ligase [Calditrichia bacterium]NIV71220.1 UDP-N-acetylmuramoyl-L-alanyl-D-glutamate--2,6-diaminopimelate ligase [Calditrichia bacterium]NIV98099.1 UDP-N-acetylmuramoyl-L-alanyl-D-glutamate--2,6-diaminopimelate ligase [Candidatus Saccharibacteria bacterium]NIW77973.1 UDP-N-acetylmuramoyl-L-alanyl-D-glutamate--2,6
MKRVSEIIAGLPVEEVIGDMNALVKTICYDSRQVSEQDAFIAIRGFKHDGHQFIEQAYQNGCRVFIVERTPQLDDVIIVRVKDTRRWLPFMAKNFFNNVVDELKIVGITGTNGKTTTAYIFHSILKKAHW